MREKLPKILVIIGALAIMGIMLLYLTSGTIAMYAYFVLEVITITCFSGLTFLLKETHYKFLFGLMAASRIISFVQIIANFIPY